MDCIFCKIVNKEIPAQIIFENNDYLAFLDIEPNTVGHTLVIPKKHIASFAGQSNEEAADHMKVVHCVATQLGDVLASAGFNVAINNGQAAGQIVNHVHWHIIPRYDGDGLKHFAHSVEAKNKLEETFKKIYGKIK
jgi:histidine triad (HIT) family protein